MILLHVTVFFLLTCTSKKAYMTAQRSEGMTTSIITFYDDSCYMIEEKTFIDNHKTKGNYTINDSIISLSTIKNNRFLQSKLLLLKKEMPDGFILYQLNENKKIDTMLLKFYADMK